MWFALAWRCALGALAATQQCGHDFMLRGGVGTRIFARYAFLSSHLFSPRCVEDPLLLLFSFALKNNPAVVA